MVFIIICFKAEHVVGVFIPFSMWVATGDSDLDFEIKLDDGLLHNVGMSRNSWEAQGHLCVSSQANIFQKAAPRCAFVWCAGFLFPFPKAVACFKSV